MERIDYAIEIEDVKKYFKAIKAVDGISLKIRKGSFLALLGPNGAGKTTLVEMIEGLQAPDHGKIKLLGKEWGKNETFLRKNLGISLQETRFIDKLRVSETLTLFSSLYGLGGHRSEEILEMIKLSDKKRSFVQNLSGGQRQRLALGIALLNDPQILLLDEPTTGLDPVSRREIWEILLKIKKRGNCTMILTTHYMEEASYLCDDIVIMDQGQIIAQGTLDELLKNMTSGEIIEFSFLEFEKEFSPDVDGIINLHFDKDTGKGRINAESITQTLPQFLYYCSQNGFKLDKLECRRMTLDDLFVSLTGRSLTEA